MAFFSRPNLDDVQFKQLSGTTLTLSGKTIFNNTTGLILTDDNDMVYKSLYVVLFHKFRLGLSICK